MNEHVIIVAGGQGLRMGGDIPKQFLPLHGLPVLMHTINRFVQYNQAINVVLVLPALHFDYWNELCQQHSFTVPHRMAKGGVTRFHSVVNGLREVSDDGITAVHDGVRPFVSVETIKACFEMAKEFGAAIPVTEPVESLRRIVGNESSACIREEYRMVQTPQVFETMLLKKSYEQTWLPSFTDDASVVEAAGHKIMLVNGNRENIKITSPLDMLLGEIVLTDISINKT